MAGYDRHLPSASTSFIVHGPYEIRILFGSIRSQLRSAAKPQPKRELTAETQRNSIIYPWDVATDSGGSSRPNTTRLMPSRSKGTWKLMSSPSFHRPSFK